ncbi:muconolactone Delta-isomerase [Streptomyces tendae]|uniref:muconolactone Delta-isomerase n=1 Tax=Streptomyces tendae TaxID=1932 RepID=UPI00368EF906
MEFLVHISIVTPADMPSAHLAELRRREAARAEELAGAGTLKRLWRVPGEWANWGLWEAPDQRRLADRLATLPLHPYMHIQVHPLRSHLIW